MSDFPPLGLTNGEDSALFETEAEDETLSTEMEGGYEMSRPRTTRLPRKTFTTGFTDISQTEKEALEAFYESKRGRADLFTYTDPTTGVEYSVRFAERIKFKYMGMGGNHRWNAHGIKLRQV